MRILLFLLVLALPALASPLSDYLQEADNVFREAVRYRQQLAASLGREQKFGPVFQVACDYNRSLANLRLRLQNTTPPDEASNCHVALLAFLAKQCEHAGLMETQLSKLVQDEARLATALSRIVEADYNRHKDEFFQFIPGVDVAEGPLLDRFMGLRQQLKPDFELQPTPEKPQPRPSS